MCDALTPGPMAKLVMTPPIAITATVCIISVITPYEAHRKESVSTVYDIHIPHHDIRSRVLRPARSIT